MENTRSKLCQFVSRNKYEESWTNNGNFVFGKLGMSWTKVDEGMSILKIATKILKIMSTLHNQHMNNSKQRERGKKMIVDDPWMIVREIGHDTSESICLYLAYSQMFWTWWNVWQQNLFQNDVCSEVDIWGYQRWWNA